MKRHPSALLALPTALLAAFAVACGGGAGNESTADDTRRTAEAPAELSSFEMEHGIGPFTSVVELAPLDADLAARGQEVFEMNCVSCHRVEDRFVGPPLGEVLSRRTPTFVLNMILNPLEMTQRHPETEALLRDYMSIMPYQNVSPDDALAILEYIRTIQL